MLKTENMYNYIPLESRQNLCSLVNLDFRIIQIQKFLSTDLPIYEFTDEESVTNQRLFNAVGRNLLEEYQDYKQRKKLKEANKIKTSNEQTKNKARNLKIDKCLQVKETNFCAGIGFFYVLEDLARNGIWQINVPESIMIGFLHMDICKIWSDKQGILRSSVIEWEDLDSEICKLNGKRTLLPYPSLLLKYETYNPEGIKIQSGILLYNNFEVQEIIIKIHQLIKNNSYIVLQEFIRPKTSSASKVRVLFAEKIDRVFRINNRKVIKGKKEYINKSDKEKIDSMEDHSASFKKLDLIKCSAEICDFFIEIFDFFDEENENFYRFSEFFKKKKIKFVKKLNCITNHQFHRRATKIILRNNQRDKLLNKYTARVGEKFSIAYPVTNFSSLDGVLVLWKEILKGSKLILPNNLKIEKIVIDFLEDMKGKMYIHKVQRVTFQEKTVGHMPIVKQFRHISLYSATEGSSFIKGKRQQVCCGDYCHILKKHDMQTREKIELLMKARPEYSKSFYKLLKIQDFLNQDSAQSLFNNGNRIGTPLTQNMQYKTVRRIILEDRNDPESLKNIISTLPNEVLQEISITQIKSKDSDQFHLHHLNKKLSWEYELVPVCIICYKIYGLRDSQTPKNSFSVSNKIDVNKGWKIKDLKFELKKKTLQKSYVDFSKILKKIDAQVSYPKFIRDKIISSQYFKVKSRLEENGKPETFDATLK